MKQPKYSIKNVKERLTDVHALIEQRGLQHLYTQANVVNAPKHASQREWNWNTMLELVEELGENKDYHGQMIILLGCHLPLLISDLLKLKWDDLYNKTMVNLGDKTISIHPRVSQVINHIVDNNIPTSEWVFANRWGDPIGTSYVNKHLKSIFVKYSINANKKPNAHFLRKMFGKRLFDVSGKDTACLIYLSTLYNHPSIQFTKEYIGIADLNLEKKNYIALM